MLKRLELNNFKKHEHLEVDFTKGLNGITGKNYQGKSTILQGVMYCLGGTRMVPGRVATRGTNSGFTQVLDFEIPGRGDYRVTRTTTGATLEHNGEVVAKGTTPVNTAMAELLGMPLKRFAQIKYARQKAADAILKYGSTELFKIVTEITGLERITGVLDLVNADLKVEQQVADQLVVVEDLEERRAGLAGVRDDAAKEAEAEGRLQGEFLLCKTGLEAEQEKERLLRVLQSDLFGYKNDLAHAETAVKGATDRYVEAQEAVLPAESALKELIGDASYPDWKKAAEQEFEDLNGKLRASRAWRDSFDSLNRIAGGLDEREKGMREAVESARQQMEGPWPAEADVAEIEKGLATARATLSDIRHQVKHAEAEVSGGVCGACKRPFDNFDPTAAADKLGKLKEEQSKAVDNLSVGEKTLSEMQERLRLFQRRQDALKQAQVALEGFLADARETRKKLEQLVLESTKHQQVAVLQEAVDDLEEKLRAAGRAVAALSAANGKSSAALQELESAKDRLSKATLSLGGVLEGTGYANGLEVEAALAKSQAAVQELRTQLAAKEAEMNAARDKRRELEGEARLLEAQIKIGEEQNAKALAVRLKVSRLETLQKMLRSNRDRYSKQVWEVFMASASMFSSTATGGKIESIERGDDGAFTFREDGFSMAIEEGSGAQQAIIGVAVQMALAESAQSPLDILLMDEPTADMDPEHALAFSTLLAASGKQVVIVTHRELDGSVFDNSITLGA